MADPKPKPGNDFLAQILKNAKAKPAAEVAKAGLETRFCSACGANREEGSDLATCAYCGASFREDRRCPRCSSPVKSRAATQCEQCGERL